jgi:hypothetical protein
VTLFLSGLAQKAYRHQSAGEGSIMQAPSAKAENFLEAVLHLLANNNMVSPLSFLSDI